MWARGEVRTFGVQQGFLTKSVESFRIIKILINRCSKRPSPPRKPFRDLSVRLQRRQGHAAKPALAVDENTLVVTEIAEFVRLDFVFLGF